MQQLLKIVPELERSTSLDPFGGGFQAIIGGVVGGRKRAIQKVPVLLVGGYGFEPQTLSV